MTLRRFAGLLLLLSSAAALAQDAPRPPRAMAIAHVRDVHGEKFVDDYFWLRERDDPDVLAYLKEENAYTDARTSHTKPLRDRLFAEMKGRLKEDDESVPYRFGDYWYYSRKVPGKQYDVNCRKKGDLKSKEEIVLDENLLAEGHGFFELGAYEVSPDHQLLAYATDVDGSEEYTLQVKDLRTGQVLADRIEKTSGDVEWADDNQTLFYTTLDDTHRPDKVFRHTLGGDVAKDPQIYHEEDERFYISLTKSRSRKYVLMKLGSQITSEVWFLDASQPEGEFRLISPRKQGVEYAVAHHGERFYIVTNDGAVNFRLMSAPVATPSREHWTEFVPYDPAVKLDSVDAFENHLALGERRNGLQAVRVISLIDGKSQLLKFDEAAYSVSLTDNYEFRTGTLRFSYESLTTPPSTYDQDLLTQERQLKKREPVPGYNPERYESERIFATAADGAQIPMSLVMRKGLPRDGRRPTLLYGYGAYGHSMNPWFSSSRVSLLDRGVIFAIAHIRGGGEMGRPWYETGKLMSKKNTFTDFITCAEHLVAGKYTSPDQLAIMGGSAGGLLIGTVINLRPELFRSAVAQVPFVDMMNTMLDETIPLTVIEYEEWGNPNEKPFYDYMRSYSPYDNVARKAYPNLLITAGLNDPRVQYWEPAKWAARLRAFKTDANTLLLKTNMGTGHAGESGRYDQLKETAFEYAFVLDTLKVPEPEKVSGSK